MYFPHCFESEERKLPSFTIKHHAQLSPLNHQGNTSHCFLPLTILGSSPFTIIPAHTRLLASEHSSEPDGRVGPLINITWSAWVGVPVFQHTDNILNFLRLTLNPSDIVIFFEINAFSKLVWNNSDNNWSLDQRCRRTFSLMVPRVIWKKWQIHFFRGYGKQMQTHTYCSHKKGDVTW